MCLNDYFDLIYMINLDKDTERLEIVTKEFAALNSTFIRVPAVVYGGGISVQDRVAGCYLSHITAMKMALRDASKLRIKPEDLRILICEDDVEFHPDILTDLPMIIKEEYDYLFLNGSGRTITDGKYIMPCGQRRQTHCISIHGAVRKVLDHFETNFRPPNTMSPDLLFERHPTADIRLFAAVKKYAIQHSSTNSSITGRARPNSTGWR